MPVVHTTGSRIAAMTSRGRRLLLVLSLVGVACSNAEAPTPDAAADEAPAAEPSPVEADADAESDTGVIPADEDVPLEPSVRLVEPGKGKEHVLAARKPGTERRVVVEAHVTEGAKKRLNVPVVRLEGSVVLDAIDDAGSRMRWTPRATAVLGSGEGLEPEFLARFQAALAPAEPPVAVPLVLDRWDVVSDLRWPTSEDPHAQRIGSTLRLALGHLAVPVPEVALREGARWEVRRQVDLWGIPAWQTLVCKVEAIDGAQLELEATASYALVADAPVTGTPLGMDAVVGLSGRGKLRARYHLPSATPIDLALTGALDIRPAEGAKPKRFGFDLHVSEDYAAQPDPRVTLTGPLVQGGLVRGVVPPGTKVWFDKEKVLVSPEGDFLVGFGRDADARALLSFAFDGGPPERHVLQVTDRVFEPEVIDGLPPEMTDPDRETRKALAKSQVRVAKVRRKVTEVAYFRDGFRWPAKGRVTSTYGRKRVLDGEDHDYHWGVDLAIGVGTKVRAPAAGVVVLAEKDVPLSGNLLILDHGHGLTSSFLHLQKLKVKEGQVVKAGQVIATSGNSGRSTGPHLDWRMNLGDVRIDPQTVVPPTP